MNQLFKYGVSFAYGPSRVEALSAVFDHPQFTALQIPERRLKRLSLNGVSVNSVDVCDLFTLSLTRSIADQSQRIIDGFVEQLCKFLTNPDFATVDTFTIDFDIAGGLKDPAKLQRRIKLLKRLIPKLYHAGKTLCLPVRIPQIGSDSTELFLDFHQQLMCINIQFCIDVHPHELSKDFQVEQLIKWLQFNVQNIRFVYEPEAGNHLVQAQIKPWIDFLTNRCFEGSILLTPVISDDVFFLREMETVCALLDSIN